MAQILGFGDGSDGSKTVTGTEDINGTPRSCSGSSGNTYVTVTAGDEAEFSAGDLVLIHQSRGSTPGLWELNKVSSTSSGQVNLNVPLSNTYVDSGADQAQILVVPQYTDCTIQSGGKIQGDSWNGNIGGIVAIACNSKLDVQSGGSIDMNNRGYRAGSAQTSQGNDGRQGEGDNSSTYNGVSTSRNSAGGGGGDIVGPDQGGPGGGGGSAGSGNAGAGATEGGVATDSQADLSIACFGGGGGGGAYATGGDGAAVAGGRGGGCVFIFANELVVDGTVSADGQTSGYATGSDGGGGGGGAGGTVLIKAVTADIGTELVSVERGLTGGAQNGWSGSNHGAYGRIRIEACTVTGSTSPTYSAPTTPLDWCAVAGGIL